MNPQYMQQQRPLYGPPPSNAPYGELNANISGKQLHDSHSFPPQKLPPTMSPTNNPLTTNNPPPANNASSVTRPPYYINDAQGQLPDGPHGGLQGLPSPQSNQNNLVDQMSNITLSSAKRPPSSQDFSSHSEKNIPSMPFPSAVNGMGAQNDYHTQGKNGLPVEKLEPSSQKQFSHQQGPPILQKASLPTVHGHPVGSQFPGQHHYPGQIPQYNSVPGTNNLRNTTQPSPTSDQHNQIPNENRYSTPLNNQHDSTGSIHPGKPPGIPSSSPSSNNQQSFSGPPLPGQIQGKPLNQPSLGPPLGAPPLSNQQNMSGPPLSGSFPPIPNRQNLSGPPLPGQNLQCSPSGQQDFSRLPPTGQINNLSGPPLPGQYLSNSFGGQNISGPVNLPGQQNAYSQYSYNNQARDQHQFSSSSLPGQQNTTHAYGHHPHSEPGYQQEYQQQHYGPAAQGNIYTHQTSPYQSGITSPTGGYQSNAPSPPVRRLDPDQMPSLIQVIQDDQKMKSGVFATNQRGLVPPLVTTKIIVEDHGNASPRFIRSSIYTIATTADIVKQIQIPFSLILSPIARIEEGEYEPPVVDMGEIGPVRCNRCKAYMSPFMQFVDAGRRFQCMFCKSTTEVPSEYFQHLDHAGQRMDRYERPELTLGTYEFLATKDYCPNNTFPNPPAIIFAIDVSYNTIKSGLVNLLCTQMKKIIQNLPVDVGQTKSNMKVGFITYSNTVQFYNIKSSLAQPQMMVVGDVQDVFMPLLDGFLCNPEESEALIDSLMSQIPTMFGDSRETETILGPVIQAGLEALKASQCAGKLMIFHSSLPIAEAPGKLKNRDDRKLLGTDKEKSVLVPQTSFYNNLGQECVGSGCSVDLFVFNNSYIDIATIGQVSRLTGGEVYKYTYFQAETDGDRLITDILNNISRPIAFDAVMRVRTSTGVRPTDFYGHLYMSNTTDIELASLDCDKAIAVEIKHDDRLSEDEGVYIQAALLYTSCSGIRKLRIINLSLNTSSNMSDIYKSCDLDAVINFLSKQSVFKLVESSPKAIKEYLNSKCASILASYRKYCASPSSAGQLILPECMKLLPLYINGLFKSDAISGGNGLTIDQKSYVMMAVATMPISESLVHVYPRLLSLHGVEPQDTDLPPMLRCSIDKFIDDGAYLLENGIHMFLWLGSNLSSQWVQSVFGVSSVIQVDTDRNSIPILDNSLNKRIREIISYVQSERRYCMRLTLTKQRDKMEMVMRQFLVEDQGADGSSGYVDFLCSMHREIRTLLS